MKRTALALPAVAAALSLAACGSGGDAEAASSTATGTATTPAPSGSPGADQAAGQQRLPGASGLVAEVAGSTAQVQSNDAQTAVTWTASTTFTAQVAATLADVKVGSCVTVRSASTVTAGTAAPTPTAQPGAPAQPTQVAATSVTLTQPVDGSCSAGPGGAPGGGVRPSGAPDGVPPSGAPVGTAPGGTPPTGAPDGAPGGPGIGRGGFGGTSGMVTSVSGTGFVIASTRPGMPSATSTATPTSVRVTTSGATAYAVQQKATAAAVTVGTCVTARGQAGSTGAVSATSISVQPAVSGACTTATRGQGS